MSEIVSIIVGLLVVLISDIAKSIIKTPLAKHFRKNIYKPLSFEEYKKITQRNRNVIR